jgi:hypothetical protein
MPVENAVDLGMTMRPTTATETRVPSQDAIYDAQDHVWRTCGRLGRET